MTEKKNFYFKSVSVTNSYNSKKDANIPIQK